ncbi:5-formyltetrahydrofolate cyclo-ligase [Polynucleobacter sp. SHI8]|uniref:5-formyltetrahydrofolate cyclo-ligase n=1 Tax=unclassified Polynucleobacter TaxID=2640945 RepID=UPI002491C66B|nr:MULTISPECIES: 5-formyltetrahydrofolate cyclo-ligase [unclassified Polynucleobacter]BDW12211.1 5-formyltetrahydrofolate cyclo-ligase [Polynucleobacter sp. SHI2]BDW14659.1 5-formyltetrahydrofolate cyclo-ligase [Polynucleobacter sp. SHI8]
MKNPSIELIRKDFINTRLDLQKDQPNYLLSNDSLKKNVLFVLQEFEKVTTKPLFHIGFYWPIRGEPSITETLIEWKSQNPLRKLALPICKKDQVLTFHEWTPTSAMTKGFGNIAEPDGTAILEVDLIFIPCIGWQKSAEKVWRLGYGGGFYDRSIQSWEKSGRRPICVGIGFDFSELSSSDWTPQVHDYPLDGILTESNYFLTPFAAS